PFGASMSSPFRAALRRVAATVCVPMLCLLAMPAVAAGPAEYSYLQGTSDQLFLPIGGERKDGEAQPVLVSREHLRRAAKSGELHARDSAGRRYVLQVEREQVERTGDVTLIARTDTVLGLQSAVITY